ncbi:Ribokinase [Schizosaccharomyces pombe]
MINIVVLGSMNTDLVMRTKICPSGGETIHGEPDGFSTGNGGKGANQAVAVARLSNPADTKVSMLGCVGDDAFGVEMLSGLKKDGVNVDNVKKIENKSTGVAMIIVEETGENRILLSEGANGNVDTAFVKAMEQRISTCNLLIMQLEIPLEAVEIALQIAHKHGVDVLMNPAPAIPLSHDMISYCAYLVPNEHEAAILLNQADSPATLENVDAYASKLLSFGVRKAVIITLGSQGAYYKSANGESALVPACKVKAVDTTAAGDTFIGAFSNSIAHGQPLKDSLEFAAKCSAITVQRKGAASSIPSLLEVDGSFNLKKNT